MPRPDISRAVPYIRQWARGGRKPDPLGLERETAFLLKWLEHGHFFGLRLYDVRRWAEVAQMTTVDVERIVDRLVCGGIAYADGDELKLVPDPAYGGVH
jgi:hypothetical protein